MPNPDGSVDTSSWNWDRLFNPQATVEFGQNPGYYLFNQFMSGVNEGYQAATYPGGNLWFDNGNLKPFQVPHAEPSLMDVPFALTAVGTEGLAAATIDPYLDSMNKYGVPNSYLPAPGLSGIQPLKTSIPFSPPPVPNYPENIGAAAPLPFAPPPFPNYPSYAGAAAPPFARNIAQDPRYQFGTPPPRPNTPIAPFVNSPMGASQSLGLYNARQNPTTITPTGQPNSAPLNTGMSPDEAKWANVAAKMGLDWEVTKNVYMNPARNGTPNVAQALGKQMDDSLWGQAAWRAGILTGDAAHDNQVWIDHYNAHGNFNYDPMAGHNDAIAYYQALQDQMQQQTNPQDYPTWYKQP